MKKVLRIDNNGFYIEDVILKDGEATPSDCVEIQCPDGFYKPKWDGTQWIEGLTQAEIDALNNQPVTPSESDRLSAVESAISALMGV